MRQQRAGRGRGGVVLGLVLLGACAETRGTAWMATPLPGESDPSWPAPPPPARPEGPPEAKGGGGEGAAAERAPGEPGGTRLGTFRNTYYNFPSETDYKGGAAKVMSASCAPIAEVTRGFYETLCVQGSGLLKSGQPVSFARRDCDCAEVCPRTGQKICFEALERSRFPWGRGSTGKPITPLLTVAVDPAAVPLGTTLYIKEYDGMPREEGGSEAHDGCFVAEDRGIRVQGAHVDIFTGDERTTALWNRLVPSNGGVTVYAGSPRCGAPPAARAAAAP